MKPRRAPRNAPHPMQPLITDSKGVLRFKPNVLVEALLDHSMRHGLGLNELTERFGRNPEHQGDWQQLAQLIGYSLSGFAELSYVDNATYNTALTMREHGMPESAARIAVLEAELKELREGLREPIAKLYGVHPDDLERS